MIPTIKQQEQIQLKYIFGLNTSIRNNLYFLDDQRIIFPAGYHIICYSMSADKSQSYFQGEENGRGFSCMTLSPMKRFLAAGVKADKPLIFIYDVLSQKKKRTLVFHEVQIKEWVSVAFGPGVEAKTLVSLSGGQGEAVVCYWALEQQRCLAWAKVTQQMTEIAEISFNPNDVSFFTCISKNVFKCYRFQNQESDNNNKGFTIKTLSNILINAPVELNQGFTCHTWMQMVDHFVVCNTSGDIIVCNENGEFITQLNNGPSQITQTNTHFIEVIIATSKGFIAGGKNAQIFIYSYNPTNQTNPYDLIQNLSVKSISEFKDNSIRGIALTPLSEERIIVSLTSNIIYSLKQKQESSMLPEHEQVFEQVTLPYHVGPINGMDICVRKPLIVTCGSDKFIRVWNYEDKSIEAYKSFNEEAHCVSFHPSGYHIIVGLSDRLRLMNICNHNNNIKHYREIVPFKACKEIKFSNGGQYFAAVNGTTQNQLIHVYRFYTVDCPPNLIFKGHTGRIRCIAWSRDDTILASCGADGMVCAWRVGSDSNGSRIIDFHQKSINFSSVALTNDSKQAYFVGADRQIRGIPVPYDGSPADLKHADIQLSQIAFPSSNKLLFAGICDENRSSGAIICYKFPMSGQTAGAAVCYQAHDERGIEKMRVTADDQYLITAGRDGAIVIYEIKDKDARGLKLKEGISKPAEEILITQEDLADMKAQLDGLNTQLTEINAQSNMINLSGKEDLIKQLLEKKLTSESQNRQAFESLLEKKREFEKKYTEELKFIKEEQDSEIQDLDTNYQKKVMQEVGKYEDLKRQQEIEKNGYDKKINQMNQDHNLKVRQLDEEYETVLQQEATQRERVLKDIETTTIHYKQTIDQIRSETQDEIKSLQFKHEDYILKVTDSGLKAKSEVSMLKKKIQVQQMEAQKLEDQQKEFREQRKQLQEQNDQLKTEITVQIRQISDLDKTIGEKEKRIYELKKRSQELEKFKFVLDHKIKELKRDIGPREEEIARMKEETNKMDQKLKKFNNYNNTLGTVVDELDTAQALMKEQIKDQRAFISHQNVRIKQFKDDVYQSVQFIQNYDELKKHCEKLYINYVNKDVKPVEIDHDIYSEYLSQRKYLEKSVSMLKKNLTKDDEIHKQDNIRIMRENVELIKEINKLRKQIKEIKFSQKGSEKSTDTAGSKQNNRQSISQSQSHIDKLNEDDGQAPNNIQINEKRSKMEQQKQEIIKLKIDIEDYENDLQLLSSQT